MWWQPCSDFFVLCSLWFIRGLFIRIVCLIPAQYVYWHVFSPCFFYSNQVNRGHIYTTNICNLNMSAGCPYSKSLLHTGLHWPAAPGEQPFPSIPYTWDHFWTVVSSFGLTNTRQTSVYQSKSSKGHQAGQRAGTQDSQGEAGVAGLLQHLDEKASRRDLTAVYSYLMGRHRQDKLRLLWKVYSNRMRGNRHKLKQGNFN